ncbi:hypothetical protein HBH70_139530 [Parastagonospora nodorum]|nr:hypothetical protein HBI78_120740 [Parastagonospora nodorum]KAH5026424.1 hypothetical protein HBI75_138400 [Parastagonospora nodorum]KAH5134260.1 hypothetical protein HBH70_139530 [Parastagonospora nodorum]KAH5421590.1 hypothetical protein HBI47_130670 [Parastagonospora nodorum]KAH5996656.1 hypothetical protein HBI84_123310 [Parastagonospora nodorum]
MPGRWYSLSNMLLRDRRGRNAPEATSISILPDNRLHYAPGSSTNGPLASRLQRLLALLLRFIVSSHRIHART